MWDVVNDATTYYCDCCNKKFWNLELDAKRDSMTGTVKCGGCIKYHSSSNERVPHGCKHCGNPGWKVVENSR